MSRANPELSGADLWDYLRTESLTHYEDTVDWPVSSTPEELASHIQEFAATVLQSNTIQMEDKGDHTLLQGRVKPRWSLVCTPTLNPLPPSPCQITPLYYPLPTPMLPYLSPCVCLCRWEAPGMSSFR